MRRIVDGADRVGGDGEDVESGPVADAAGQARGGTSRTPADHSPASARADMTRGFDTAKASPESVARAIFDGVENADPE
jgi:hypothetical protein